MAPCYGGVTLRGFRLQFGFCVFSAIALTSGAVAAVEPQEHHGDALLRVETWPDDAHALGLDVWTHRTAVPSVLARVTPQQRALLDASGVTYTVVEPDLGPQIEAERARLAAATPMLGGGLDPAFYDDFRQFDLVLDRIAAWAANEPDRVSVVEAGLSLEGRAIRGVRITNPGGPADRPVVLVQATMHAREWAAVAGTMYAAEQFITAPGGSALDALLDQAELLVVPVVNPDGYIYSWDVERLWRKNRRDGVGVDLNRNWGWEWGGQGASPIPEEDIYHGPAAFSEPESIAMRDLIDAEPDMIAMLDVHSFGQLLLYPWGYDYVDSVDDLVFANLAADMAAPMMVPYGQQYLPLQSSDLYPASGNAIDWAYGAHGIYAITIEVRPTFFEKWGFLLPPDQIVPTGEELVAGISTFIESSLVLGGTPGGSSGTDTGGSESTTGGASSGGTTAGADESSGSTTGGGLPTTSGGTPTSGGSSGVEPPPPPGGTGTEAGSSEGGEPGQDDGGGGCACRVSDDGGGGVAWWWLLPVLGLRRRRR